MASQAPDGPEKLIFDTKGDVFLIFTRRAEDKNQSKDVPKASGSLKRKSPDDTSKTVTMLVSSKHMTLASPVFDAMLSDGRFKEGSELLANGHVEIELPDDDPVAFAIIANVIHHRNKMVPGELPFQLLTEVAILTEKYQLFSTMQWVSCYWMSKLSRDESKRHKFSIDGPATIFISLVFGDAVVFKTLTKEAILSCGSQFGGDINDRYYLPSSIVDSIKAARQQAFSDVFAALDSFLKRGTEPASYCNDLNDVCGIMTTGSFLKSMAVNDCWPFRPEPYAHTNLRRLFRNASEIEIRTSCPKRKIIGHSTVSMGLNEKCMNRKMFAKMMLVQIKGIEQKILGLDIEKFQQKTQQRAT